MNISWRYEFFWGGEMRTVLVNDFICRGLPFFLGKYLNNNDIAFDGSVHVLAPNE
jgi:hypothetical protein